MKYLTASLFLVFVFGCKINIEYLPHSEFNVLYSEYNSKVANFSNRDNKNIQLGKNNVINIEDINSNELQLIVSKNPYTWVIVWAPWCAACVSNLSTYVKESNNMDKDSLELVLICSNYDLPNINKQLLKANYHGTVYIINANNYTMNETENIKTFSKEISHLTLEYNGSLPQNYIFMRNKMLKGKVGKMDIDSIKNYIK